MTREEFDKFIHQHLYRVFVPRGGAIPVFQVRKLYVQLTRKWIPCSERLPKKKGTFEVTYGVSSLSCTARQVTHAFFNPKLPLDSLFCWTDKYNEPVLYVKAWREMPEPYWPEMEE
jgi:hypothetical protein